MSNKRELSELTPNQKAATFIGWRGCPHDKSANVCDGTLGQSLRTKCGSPDMHDYHHVRLQPCDCESLPDMTDPRNYMKAVAVLMAHDRSVRFSRQWIIVHDEHGTNLAEADTHTDIGTAMTKLLARLYDAERGQGAAK